MKEEKVKRKGFLKRVGATILAALCLVTTAQSLGGGITASAADKVNPNAKVERNFATTDEVVGQAAKLLGVPYIYGRKGFNNVYNTNSGAYTPEQLTKAGTLPAKNRGIDCSGLLYWTFRTLGYYSSGFSISNQLPYDGYEWTAPTNTVKKLGKKDTDNVAKGVVTIDGVTSAGYVGVNHKEAPLEEIEWQKRSTDSSTQEKKPGDWWLKADGTPIDRGSIVIADDGTNVRYDSTQEHCWIYIGEFESKEAVAKYISGLTGLSTNYLLTTNCGGYTDGTTGAHTASTHKLIEDKTAENKTKQGLAQSSTKKYTHWRIESNGTDGVCINNGLTAKNGAVLKVSTMPLARDTGNLKITKYIDPAGSRTSFVATKANYPDYTKIKFALQVVNVSGLTAGKYIRVTRQSDKTYRYDDSAQYTNYTENEGVTPNIVNENGTVEITDLPLGTYKLVETTDFASLGLQKYAGENIVISENATTDSNGYITKNVTNKETEVNLTVNKTTSNTLGVKDTTTDSAVVSAAQFMIYDETAKRYVRASGSNGAYTYIASDKYSNTSTDPGTKFKLGTNGKFSISGLSLKNKKYSVVEIVTASGWTIPTAKVTVDFTTAGETKTANFDNARKGATMTVVKTGKTLDGHTYTAAINDKDYPELAKKLNEAVEFKVYDWNGKYIKATGSNGKYTFASANSSKADGTTFKLGTDGSFAIDKLPTTPDGKKYFAEEVKTAKGYKLTGAQGIVLTTNASNPVVNEEYPTSFEVDKKFVLGTIGGGKITDQMYEKIEFVAKNSSGKYIIASIGENAGEYTKTAYTTDKSKATVMHLDKTTHKAVVKNVEEDTYTVEEMVDESIFTATKGTDKVESTEDGKNVAELINTELTGGFEIYKKTKTMNNISGIKLHLYGKSNSGRTIDVQTAETDETGYVKSEGIPYGTYTLEEVRETVDSNYDLIEPMTIVIDKPFKADENKKEITNDFRSGEVNIIKQDKNGTKLAGFEFTLTAAEDIYEGAKKEENLIYKQGDKIEVITTADDGSGKSSMVLPFGYKYTLTETKAVAPYNKDADPITFTLNETEDKKSTYTVVSETGDATQNLAADDSATTTDATQNTEADGSTTTTDALEVLVFEDSQQEGNLTIYKTDDRNEKVFLDGAEFDVIALEDIVVNGKVKFKANDVVKHVVTKDGKAEVKLYTNFNYGLKETKAPQGYVLSDDITKVNMKYEVNLLYTEQTVSVKNGRQTGKLTIYKVDKNNNKVFLEGAEFDVIAKTDITVSGDEHKAGDVLAHVKTGKDGKASLKLWSGYTYVLKETKAPYGYDKLDKVIEVSVDYNPNIKYTETNVRIENQKKPEAPKTGVTKSLVPVCIVGGVAIVALGAVVMLLKKKKTSK